MNCNSRMFVDFFYSGYFDFIWSILSFDPLAYSPLPDFTALALHHKPGFWAGGSAHLFELPEHP
jgi:hypothetical protein